MSNNYFKNLVAKAQKATNSEEAKRIRKKLIKIGAIMAILGFSGSFACFVMFGIIGFNNVTTANFNGFGLILIPFFLITPCFLVGTIGVYALYLGLSIVVGSKTVDFLDENSYCPYCGDVVEPDEKFCDKCGKPLLKNKICNDCGYENDMKAKFCKNCGKKL